MNHLPDSSESRGRGRWFLIALGLLVIAILGIRTISHFAFWTHLTLGRLIAESGIPRTDTLSFVSADAPWMDSDWLYDRLLYGLWGLGGAPAVILFHVSAALAAFILLIPVARKWANDTAVALALFLSAWLIAPRLVADPRVVGLAFASAFILLLSLSRAPVVLLLVLPVLQVIWTNLHGSFLLGPFLCAVFLIETLVRERARGGGRVSADGLKQVLTGVAVTVAVLIATLVNPYGVELQSHVLRAAIDVASNFVQEWISPFSANFGAVRATQHLVTFSLLIGAGGLIVERRKLPVALTTLAVLSAFLVVRSLRYMEGFAILAFPFLALSLDALGGFVESHAKAALKQAASWLSPMTAAVVVLLAVASIGVVLSGQYYTSTGSLSRFGLGAEYEMLPKAASAVISRADFPRRAVNFVMDGGFLAWDHPGRRVFVDHRANLYGLEFFRDLSQCLLTDEKIWETMEERWDPGAVIVNCCLAGSGTAVRTLLQSKRWALAYFDGTTAVLARSLSENKALIEDTEVKSAGLQVLEQEQQRYALAVASKPGVSARIAGAGNFYMGLERYHEAKACYDLLVRGAPRMAVAWLSLGIAETQLGENPEAVDTLREACRLMPKNVWSWLYLSRAATRAGQLEEAAAAQARANRLDARLTDAFSKSDTDKTAVTNPPAPAP
jgi:tetratricopeptide (TPR) repeat protein